MNTYKRPHEVTDDEAIVHLKELILHCKLCGCCNCKMKKDIYRHTISVLQEHKQKKHDPK